MSHTRSISLDFNLVLSIPHITTGRYSKLHIYRDIVGSGSTGVSVGHVHGVICTRKFPEFKESLVLPDQSIPESLRAVTGVEIG